MREGYGQPDAAADGIAFAASKCVPLPGTFEADECIDCVVGKNSTVTGSEEARACIDCAIGMYIEDIRSDECIDCVIGKCVDEAASTECTIGRCVEDTCICPVAMPSASTSKTNASSVPSGSVPRQPAAISLRTVRLRVWHVR